MTRQEEVGNEATVVSTVQCIRSPGTIIIILYASARTHPLNSCSYAYFYIVDMRVKECVYRNFSERNIFS